MQCGPDEPSWSWTQIWVQACMSDYCLNWTARSSAIQRWQRCQCCCSLTRRWPSWLEAFRHQVCNGAMTVRQGCQTVRWKASAPSTVSHQTYHLSHVGIAVLVDYFQVERIFLVFSFLWNSFQDISLCNILICKLYYLGFFHTVRIIEQV